MKDIFHLVIQVKPSIAVLLFRVVTLVYLGWLWFQGVGPTANRAAVVCGVELPIYDVCKKYIILSKYLGDNELTHFV